MIMNNKFILYGSLIEKERLGCGTWGKKRLMSKLGDDFEDLVDATIELDFDTNPDEEYSFPIEIIETLVFHHL